MNVYANVDELARALGISRHKAYQALRAGEIPSIRLGRRFVLPKSAISEWLKTAGGRLQVGA